MPPEARTGPVVLLGFDAADPDLVERWAREGKLPSMARLMARGTWARTGGEELLFEHAVWSTLLSGVSGTHLAVSGLLWRTNVDSTWATMRG